MKLATLFFIGAVAVLAQTERKRQTISRVLVSGETTYIVTYEYDPLGVCSIPATNPPGQPHYGCTVRVYEAKQIGKPFEGTVTENGCWEDQPSEMVKKAQNHR